MTGLKFVTVSVLGYLFMLLAQHFYIYKYLIVLQNPPLESIPSLWYFGWMLPTIIMIFAVGYWSKNLTEVAVITFFLGVANSLEMYSIYIFNGPDGIQGVEAPLLTNIGEILLQRFLIILIPAFLVFISRRLIAHFIEEVEEHVLEEI
jgi:hypothetical protein